MPGPSVPTLLDHLFRHDAGKLVSVLTRIFGSQNIELAEDVVQDSFTEALNVWSYKGVPDNPSGWLFRVAKNKAINIINRQKVQTRQAADLTRVFESDVMNSQSPYKVFSDNDIHDDQLRMMFTCCHPSISADSQVALTLKTLCGFNIPEIARAFLTSEENINKRLVRAREKIRAGAIAFEVPEGRVLEERLDSVLETIYLLFNEGYKATSGHDLIRFELCEESIRLAEIIASHRSFLNKRSVYALLSLMYLNACRFQSRTDGNGRILTLAEQDRLLWDAPLMEKGFSCLEKSAVREGVTIYHILAAISAHHCAAKDFQSTDWKGILGLYDRLIQMDHSPLVILNRAVALAQVQGPKHALTELEAIEDEPALASYHLFYSTRAELLIQLGEYDRAVEALKKAISLSPLDAEKALLESKLELCASKLS